jgi:hypothetical protein
MGSSEIRISPPNGWSSWRIRKIAPATETAQTKRTAMTVGFTGAKSAKRCEDHREPERQHHQEGHWNGAARLFQQERTDVPKIGADLKRFNHQRSLAVVLRRELLDLIEELATLSFMTRELSSPVWKVRPDQIEAIPARPISHSRSRAGFACGP